MERVCQPDGSAALKRKCRSQTGREPTLASRLYLPSAPSAGSRSGSAWDHTSGCPCRRTCCIVSFPAWLACGVEAQAGPHSPAWEKFLDHFLTLPKKDFGARLLSRRLSRLGIPHEYEESEDDHLYVNYRYVRSLRRLAVALKWASRHLTSGLSANLDAPDSNHAHADRFSSSLQRQLAALQVLRGQTSGGIGCIADQDLASGCGRD